MKLSRIPLLAFFLPFTFAASVIEDFVDNYWETYFTLTGEADMHSATVHCPCGNPWTYIQADHYRGEARYPQRCPACNDEALKKVSSS